MGLSIIIVQNYPNTEVQLIFFGLYIIFEKEINGTFHYVNEKLDAGDIILESNSIAIIKNISVFKLWYAIRKEAYIGWKKIIRLMENKKIPSKKQNSADSVLRSFPNESILSSIRKSGHSFLTISDIIFYYKNSNYRQNTISRLLFLYE